MVKSKGWNLGAGVPIWVPFVSIGFLTLGNRLTKLSPWGWVDLLALAPKLTLLHSDRQPGFRQPAEEALCASTSMSGPEKRLQLSWALEFWGLFQRLSPLSVVQTDVRLGRAALIPAQAGLRLLSGKAVKAFQNLEPECFDFSPSSSQRYRLLQL